MAGLPLATSKYPVPCPGCQASAGYPRRVLTDGPERVIVSLRCDVCQHAWESTEPSLTPWKTPRA